MFHCSEEKQDENKGKQECEEQAAWPPTLELHRTLTFPVLVQEGQWYHKNQCHTCSHHADGFKSPWKLQTSQQLPSNALCCSSTSLGPYTFITIWKTGSRLEVSDSRKFHNTSWKRLVPSLTSLCPMPFHSRPWVTSALSSLPHQASVT